MIYRIVCLITGKKYIGQTTMTIEVRWRAHVHASTRPTRTQPIASAIRKHGRENFTIEIVEECFDQATLDEAELRWALAEDTFAPNGYNLRAGNGPGSMSEVTRQRLRDLMTEERKEALRALWKGRPLPPEAYATQRANRLRPMTLISPDGELTVIEDVPAFAAEHELNASLLSGVHSGARLAHLGWRLIPDEPVTEAALALGDGMYSCPACPRVWRSPSPQKAQQHVTSCVRLTRARDAAYLMGNISEETYRRALERRAQPLVQVRDRRIKRARLKSGAPKKTFTVLSPSGQLVTSTGIMEFIELHDLHPASFRLLLSGRRNVHRGWRRACAQCGAVMSKGQVACLCGDIEGAA